MRSTGRDRVENFLDALRLLQAVQNNPVGARDYVAWFNTGWIQWQKESLGDAEEAFYQSARLSASEPAFQSYALQHLAHIKYLRGQYEAAYETGRRALNMDPERAELVLDVARYAARVKREPEAVTLLQECFDQNPIVFAFALGESDLSDPALAHQTESLLTTRQKNMTEEIGRDVEAWQHATQSTQKALEQAELELAIPSELSEQTLHKAKTLLSHSLDYFTLLAVQGQVQGKAEALRTLIAEQLESESVSLSEQMERLTKQVEKIFADRKQWQHNIKQMELEARQAGYPLTDLGGFARWKLRMKKLEHRYNTARMMYQPTKENLAQAEAQIKNQIPALHETIRKLKERRDKIEAARGSFGDSE
jgi:tetratricopeptide (TPR) repeat protein